MPPKHDLTTIRIKRETAEYINDVKRMLELVTGNELTQGEVVEQALKVAFGKQLKESQQSIRSILEQSDEETDE